MNTIGRYFLLLPMALTLIGCLSVNVKRTTDSSPDLNSLSGDERAAIAEIDAVTELTFDNDKEERLVAIANRPHLSPPVLVHLVNQTYARVRFDNNRTTILVAAINSPSYCPQVKEAIVDQLEKLKFSSSKKEVLTAIQKREAS